MVPYLVAGLVTVAFLGIVWVLRIVPRSGRILEISRQAMRDLSDKAHDDDRKEALAQGHAVSLFKVGIGVAAGLIVAALAPAALVVVGELAGLFRSDDVWAAALSWPFLLVSTAVAVAVFVLAARTR